ncbi:DUF3180 domain-containing protein [Nesterenkonia sphaerica]|uniref:DUF3180 domain-containing protein n=1 Tax=Nesterenkonia sphaerica TaxID=1804988 RepID=A0A5R9A261_9MICC|nr:DUF3180 domain-containing protein [Nesterenkonia sphaerica]TLP72753.1 DUF3180 domain-containing protein [Nesterenkonia sphaerica]
MTQLRPLWLLVIALGAALAGYLATVAMSAGGFSSPVLPLSSAVTLGAIGGIVLILGLIVWRDQRRIEQAADEARREKPRSRPARRIHPLQAVRVVAAGQACAYAGALIAGWHAGVLIDLAPAAGAGTPNVTSALVVVIGGLIWVITGFVVETLGKLPPDSGLSQSEPRFDDNGTEPNAAL